MFDGSNIDRSRALLHWAGEWEEVLGEGGWSMRIGLQAFPPSAQAAWTFDTIGVGSILDVLVTRPVRVNEAVKPASTFLDVWTEEGDHV